MQAAMLIAASLWDLGYSQMVSREVAAGKMEPSSAFSSGVAIRLTLLPLFAGVFLVGWSLVNDLSTEARVAFLLVMSASCLLGLSSIFLGLLTGLVRFRSVSLAQSLGRIASTGYLALLVMSSANFGLAGVAVSLVLGELVVIIAYIIAIKRINIGLNWRARASPAASLHASWPYAMNGVFTLVYNRADVILITFLAGTIHAGLYAPASRVQDALMIAPNLAIAGLVPIAARAFAKSGQGAVQQAFRFSMSISMGVSIPLVFVAWMSTPWFISAFLGNDYSDAVTPVRVLMLAVPLAAIEAPILSLLISQGHAKMSTLVYVSALLTSLLGHLLLTPQYGATGAAWASFLREPVALAACLYLACRLKLISIPKALRK
jgi:O-antigen/teichoic acid export membrane protein